MDKISTEILIVGGGVVGLAIARELAASGHEAILIEKNNYFAEEVSARNSGVVHGGFYYPKDSLKSLLCNKGNKKLYSFCDERNIPIKKTGKLLLGNSNEDLKKINQYVENARHYGGEPLTIINKESLKDLEPNIKSSFAMLSPETGIIDAHEFCQSLANEFQSLGGHLSLRTALINFKKSSNFFVSQVATEGNDFLIESRFLICATGLHSYDLAQKWDFQINNLKKLNYSKGHYFKLKGSSPFNHLIYPMPTLYGLGIHAGFDLDGSVRFGPDTELVTALDYSFDSQLKDKFINAIRLYYPSIQEDDLIEDYVGIRPKIQLPTENFADFSILNSKDHKIDNFLYLQGIESPGLTCSLMLAEYIYNNLFTFQRAS
jgi:L-2-hydroxyglutarate oxidase LhgO